MKLAYTGCTRCLSMYRVYMLGLTLEWIKTQGGVEAMDKVNKTKSRMIYDVIDYSDGFY